jgi:hypothetical protein
LLYLPRRCREPSRANPTSHEKTNHGEDGDAGCNSCDDSDDQNENVFRATDGGRCGQVGPSAAADCVFCLSQFNGRMSEHIHKNVSWRSWALLIEWRHCGLKFNN